MDLKEFLQNHEITITSDNENCFKCIVKNLHTNETKQFNYDSFINGPEAEVHFGQKLEDIMIKVFSNDIKEHYNIQ